MSNVETRAIEEEMKSSYMDYAMSVIVGRSLPDVRDGLKPVQRRILYSMYEMNLTHDKPYKKSARIVGEVMGKYHPHGEAPIYDALVRMAQPFSMRYTFVDGQGNFGSIDGDTPAAMRYTEARLTKIAEEMLEDIEKETVPMVMNFDGTLKEPAVLPSKIPNLLINGSSGIAVGMATNMPPHNIVEVIDAIIYYINNRDADVDDLINFIKGPDFPTGGQIFNFSGIIEAYKTGKGTFKLRGKYHIEGDENQRSIVFTEIPYEVNKSDLLQKIASLIKEEKITGIQNIKDESDKNGIRIIFKLKKDANVDIVLNQLFEHSQLEISYGIINLAIIDNIPRLFTLKDLIEQFVNHRFNIIKKRVEYDLKKDEEREHILKGFLIALDNLDDVISTIRSSLNYDEAKRSLIEKFSLTELQAKAILDLRLQRLTAMERESIVNEEKSLSEEIEKLKGILSDERKIYQIMVEELNEIKEKYGDERRTEIVMEEITRRDIEDLIPPENVLVSFSKDGYIKRIPLSEYREQSRGGVGLITEYGEKDYPKQIFIANNRDTLLLFTNKGKVYWLKCYRIVQTSRKANGKNIINYVNLEENERVEKIIPVKGFDSGYIIFLTRKGYVKRTPLKAFSNPMKKGIIAINLGEDSLADVLYSEGNNLVLIGTKNGIVTKFSEEEIRPTGRNSYGVKGIRLSDKDEIIGMAIGRDEDNLLTLTEFGKGKRTKISEFRLSHRGAMGVKAHRLNKLTGSMVSMIVTDDSGSIMVQTMNGMTIQIPVKEIPVLGRNTSGVRIIELKENDRVITSTKIPEI